MRRMHLRPAIFGSSRRTAIGVMLVATVISTGCTTNYLPTVLKVRMVYR